MPSVEIDMSSPVETVQKDMVDTEAAVTAVPMMLKRPVQMPNDEESPKPTNAPELDAEAASTSSVCDRGSTSSPCPSEASTGLDISSDPNGIDAVLLNSVRNPKNRLFVLKLDKQCEEFLKDESQSRLEFPQMNSYQRLIVHRLAVYFKLVHVSDATKKGVVLYKCAESEIPSVRLLDIPLDDSDNSQAAMASIKIMQRHHHHRSSRHSSTDSGSEGTSAATLKSIEEREAAYQAARARIFQEDCESDVSSTSRTSSNTTKSTQRHQSRNHNSRSKNSQGQPRQRYQQVPPYAGMMPYPMQMGVPAQYQPYDSYPRNYPTNPSAGIRATLRAPPQPYDGMFMPPPNANPGYHINPPPQPGPGFAQNMPYCDWNGAPYSQQMSMSGQIPDEPLAPNVFPNASTPASMPGGYQSGQGRRHSSSSLNPQAQPFTPNPQAQPFIPFAATFQPETMPALHYHPETGGFVPGPPLAKLEVESKLGGALNSVSPQGITWASIARDGAQGRPPSMHAPEEPHHFTGPIQGRPMNTLPHGSFADLFRASDQPRPHNLNLYHPPDPRSQHNHSHVTGVGQPIIRSTMSNSNVARTYGDGTGYGNEIEGTLVAGLYGMRISNGKGEEIGGQR